MTPLRSRFIFQSLSAVILLSNLRVAEQQQNQLSTYLSFCAESSTESTLKTFWNEARGNCALDPFKTIDLYAAVEVKKGDKCSQLLSHHLRKSVIDSGSRIYAEALISESFRNNVEINQLSEQLAQLPPEVSQAVWEQTIDEIYLFINRTELAEAIYQDGNAVASAAALLYLHQKYLNRADHDTRLPVVLVHCLNKIKNRGNFASMPTNLQRRVEKTLNRLPEQLRLLYTPSLLGLLNTAHWEFLYAPRVGTDSVRRTALTWLANKNSTDSNGDLTIEIHGNGDVAFGSFYEQHLKYLYVDADQKRPFFWIGDSIQPNRWWQVGWHGDFFTFENLGTNLILCATIGYDENSRQVTLRSPDPKGILPDCRWILKSQANVN